MKFVKSLLPAFDPLLLLYIFPIPIFGLVMLLSTAPKLFYAQIVFFVLSLIVIWIISHLEIMLLKQMSIVAYFGAIGLIFLVFLFGDVTRGSYRWITIGAVNLQPSEFVKPLLIIFFAALFSRLDMQKIKNVVIALICFAIPFLLIFKEPDLGSALVIAIVFFGMLFISRVKIVYFLLLILLLGGLTPFAWKFTHQYQRERIMAFLHPNADPLGKTYNITQAMIAVGSGEFFGRGLGQGTQTHLKFLPEYTTDFIYASLGEELGFVGSLVTALLFALFFWRTIQLSESIDNRFAAEIVFGIGLLLFSQSFIHIGGNIGILPLTGITLPFISYGGSSVLATAFSLGLLSCILRNKKKLLKQSF